MFFGGFPGKFPVFIAVLIVLTFQIFTSGYEFQLNSEHIALRLVNAISYFLLKLTNNLQIPRKRPSLICYSFTTTKKTLNSMQTYGQGTNDNHFQ